MLTVTPSSKYGSWIHACKIDLEDAAPCPWRAHIWELMRNNRSLLYVEPNASCRYLFLLSHKIYDLLFDQLIIKHQFFILSQLCLSFNALLFELFSAICGPC